MFEVNEKNNVALDSEHYDGETLKDGSRSIPVI